MKNDFLRGKAALVTGSTSGLGRAISEALAAAGCRVILNGFGDAAGIEALRRSLGEASGTDALYLAADLTKPDEIAALAERALAACGAVDIVVNNAGTQFVAPVAEFPDAKWDLLLALNLSAAFHVTKALLPAMRARGWGRIVNVASAHGLVASPFKAAYVASKHGLVGLTKVVALETARDGITCNAVCPGFVRTAVVESQIAEQARLTGLPEEEVVERVLLSKHPNGAFVRAEEVAALVLHLCSDGAASLTGASLPLDGGWTAV